MSTEFKKVINIENTLYGWSELSRQAERAKPITIITTINGRLNDSQLFCLRYCFAELDRLDMIDKAPSALTLQISVTAQSDAYRIQHYLAIMTSLRKNISLEIICGNTTILGQRRLADDYYRIIPLFCVGADMSHWLAHYFTIITPGNIESVRKQVESSFQENYPLVSQTQITSVVTLLERLCIQNLWTLQHNLSGSDKEKMLQLPNSSNTVKDTLRKELLEYLTIEFPQLGLLARLLWSLFLRSLSDSKDLFFRDNESNWHVDMETLRCSRLDAISYAEGILQLIENACIHSYIKRSYISIRLNDVDISTKGIEKLAEAARVRSDIDKRYKKISKNCSVPLNEESSRETTLEYTLDPEAKFCLEISVFNDSADLSGKPYGHYTNVCKKPRKRRKRHDFAGRLFL